MTKKVIARNIMKFKELYQNGESILSISKKFCLHHSTVYKYLKISGVKIRSPKESALLAYSKGLGKMYRIPKTELTEDKAYILGVMYGDGYMHRTKNNSYQIGLCAVDWDFVLNFANAVKNVYKIEPRFGSVDRRVINWNKQHITWIYSKAVYLDVLKFGLVGTKKWDVPKDIMNSTNSIKSSFLRGFFDSEGCVDSSKKINIVSTNKRGLISVKKLLISLGIISSNIHTREGTGNRSRLYVINITGKKNIDIYCKLIGFSICRKQKKLEKLISDYKLTVTPNREVKKMRGDMVLLRKQNMSYLDISKELGLSIGTVWKHLNNKI